MKMSLKKLPKKEIHCGARGGAPRWGRFCHFLYFFQLGFVVFLKRKTKEKVIRVIIHIVLISQS